MSAEWNEVETEQIREIERITSELQTKKSEFQRVINARAHREALFPVGATIRIRRYTWRKGKYFETWKILNLIGADGWKYNGFSILYCCCRVLKDGTVNERNTKEFSPSWFNQAEIVA